MTDVAGIAAHLWPSGEQQLLLTAALADGAPSLAAFHQWRARVDLMAEFNPEVVRLLPLVYHNMQRQGVEDPVMGRLKGAYRRTWYDTHRLFYQVQPLVAAFQHAGVDVLLLKGAPLALGYYDNVALRPMGDVDIAIPADHLSRAMSVLDSLRWRPIAAVDVDLLRFRHAAQCIGPDGAEIDLHWHVLNEAPSAAADRDFAATTEPVEFLGVPVRQLDPTALLLLLIVHGVRWNDDTPIRWIPDAMMVLRRRGAEVDWDRMVDLAGAHRVAHRLGLGLSYLAHRFAAPVPPEILGRLAARPLSSLERIERTVLLRDNLPLRHSVVGNQWLHLVEYLRYADTRNPFAFANGFSHYLRWRMKLRGRRDMLPLAIRGLGRWITRRPAVPAGSAGATAQ
jgi:hypothetical protein